MSIHRLKVIRGVAVKCNHCEALAWYKGFDRRECQTAIWNDGWHDYGDKINTGHGVINVLHHICAWCQRERKKRAMEARR